MASQADNAATTPTVSRKLAREHARKRHYKKALERIVEASDGESAVTLKAIAREALS